MRIMVFLVLFLTVGMHLFSPQSALAAQPYFTDQSPLTGNSDGDYNPHLATDGNGRWIAVWYSNQSTYQEPGTGNVINVGTDTDIWFAVSDDDGETWSSPLPLNSNARTDSGSDSMPIIETAGAGTWVVVWQSTDPLGSPYIGTDTDILVCRSTNNGVSWSNPAPLNSNAASDGSASDDNPHLDYGNGRFLVAWSSNNSLGGTVGSDYDIFWSESSDGATWTVAAALNKNAGTDSGGDIHPFVLYQPGYFYGGQYVYGVWHVAWDSWDTLQSIGKNIGADHDILVSSKSTAIVLPPNPAPDWSQPSALNTNASTDSANDNGVAMAASGQYVVAVWGDYSDIRVSRKSHLVFWTSPAALNSIPGGDYTPWIAVGNGGWLAVWAGIPGGIFGTDSDIFYSTSSDGLNWSAYQGMPLADSDSGNDSYPVVVSDGKGQWLTAWYSTDDRSGTIGTDYDIMLANVMKPAVYWIPRIEANPNDKDIPTVRWEVWFTEPVWGVNVSDFSVTTTGITGASITSVGTTFYHRYTVSANTGTGEGTITLNILDDDSIVDADGNSLGGWGTGNGNVSGGTYTLETKPVVSNITLLDGSPTNAGSVRFQVVFSENVTGVDATDFSTVTSGGISGTSIANVAAVDGRTYRVTVNTGTGDGLLYLRVVDNDSIRDIIPGFSTGIGLGGWGSGNGTFTSSVYCNVDKSDPVAGVIEPDGGPFTNQNTQLTFNWRDFFDDQSGIAYFEVQFGPLGDPDGYLPWTSVGNTGSITFSAVDILGSGAVFAEGTYVCSVRAVNNVGLASEARSATKTVDTTAFRVGEAIPLPDTDPGGAPRNYTWNEIDWVNTTFGPSTHVVFIEHAEKLLVGDYGSAVTVNWAFVGGGGLTRNYNTSSETAEGHDPVVIYHTHTDDGLSTTRAPAVSLLAFNNIRIHYNQAVPDETHLWYDGSKNLYARGLLTSEPALVILEFNDTSNPTGDDYIGFQVLQVKRCEPDVQAGTVDIGSRLLPARMPAIKAKPQVTSGFDVGGVPYVYQHGIPGSPQEGDLWAIHKNTDPANMEVIWKEVRQYQVGLQQMNVVWPFEFRRYRSPNWPTDALKYQKYVRGDAADDLGPEVIVPDSLNAEVKYQEFGVGHYADLSPHPEGQAFDADGPGWALLKYQTGLPAGYEWVGFEVIRCVNRLDPLVMAYDTQDPPQPISTPWDIGAEITDPYHEGQPPDYRPGYVHVSEGDRYAPGIYETDPDSTGQIFAVNTGILEVWWYNLSRIEDPEGPEYPAWPEERVQWPSKVMRYSATWPSNPDKIIIASTLGSGDIDPVAYGSDWSIYARSDSMAPGFNPNDEHALVRNGRIYALRCDLGTPQTSDPYVLMKYREQTEPNLYRFRVFQVAAEGDGYFFHQWGPTYSVLEDPYKLWAGTMVQAPYPVNTLLGYETDGVGTGPNLKWWEDVNGNIYARAAGDDGVSPADLTVRFHYPVQADFYFPQSLSYPYAHGYLDVVPWLDRLGNPSGDPTGIPVDVTYRAYWPEEVAGTIKIGQTVVNGGENFFCLNGNCTAAIIYDQSVERSGDPSRQSVLLINPVKARSVPLASIPPQIATLEVNADGESLKTFPDLSLALQKRVGYSIATGELRFWGVIIDPDFGFQYPILNVMSAEERDELCALDDGNSTCGSSPWDTAVKDLFNVASEPVTDVLSDWSSTEWTPLALTAGYAQGTGYVTIALQNSEGCQNDPDAGGVSLKVVRVEPDLFTGKITPIYGDCAFKETVTMRHSGDFGGHPENYHFQWVYMTDPGYEPETPVGDNPAGWSGAADETGAIEFTIQGPGLLTLSDNYFSVRYMYTGPGMDWSNTWSDWTEPTLAEGWIKRVVGDINGYTQGGTGGGVQGGEILGPIEEKFFEYGGEIDTVISMITKAGARWTGDIPLSCRDLNQFGLIEIYETVLNRGAELSIDAGYDDDAANNALLLVASRIADLYVLLGNEAYADAQDPTIAFGTDDGQYGAEASSIHCFMNVEGGAGSLIEEELSLLRGRDDSQAGGVRLYPLYNRLVWNYTNGFTGGEVAYSLNYNIYDKTDDGVINLSDAKALFPQGHGDAWGHYLTALKTYYRLLTHPNYEWKARSESLLVGGESFTVDYYDERKFAAAAAAKARTGAEIVNLTYREEYVENPAGQWQGYKDTDPDRAWGLSEWASRAGEGAYIDWVVGNAVLPAASTKTGVEKIDRTTVLELREVASRFQEIQAQVDMADVGLNPLGLATNVIPFDIDPSLIKPDQGVKKTHFEQIYDRAVVAMNNAIAVFNHANNSTQLLRRQADSQAEFEQAVDDREIDFKNRLIEIYGYPYQGDPQASNLNGPDLKHYMYIDPSQLIGWDRPPIKTVTGTMTGFRVLSDGSLQETQEPVTLHYSTDADRFGLFKPDESWGDRLAPGEIQLALSDVLQARARFERALNEYNNLVARVEEQAELLEAQHNLNAEEINVLNAQLSEQERLDDLMARSRAKQLDFRTRARMATLVQSALAEALPTSNGFSNDFTSIARSAIQLIGTAMTESYTQDADRESLVELDHQQAMQAMQAQTNIVLTTKRSEFAVLQQVKQLEQMVREEHSSRLELYAQQEAMHQACARYRSALARGLRLQEDIARFKRQTAAEVQSRRYKDMAFRIFRNDALQKYRAQFDMAARYVYLAAKAYDYETTFLSNDWRAGERFLTNIVRERLIGTISSGQPQTGVGLADPMKRMSLNFSVLKGQLGLDNPQWETNRLSLRSELFRILPGSGGNAAKWRETLWHHVVPNLLDLPEFQRYCHPFWPQQAREPGIVIPFSTNINEGLNVFGWPAMGGDVSYDSSHYTTKVRSVGVWFSNYNNLMIGGMLDTPRVYLVPVGADIQRSPTGYMGATREFKVLDQVLPLPYDLGDGSGELTDPFWIPCLAPPMNTFADVRRFARFRAYHDSGTFNESEVIRDSRLIGRSVWNTKWLLIIPAGSFYYDRQEGLKRFIDGMLVGDQRDGNGVSDISIIFETYAYAPY